MSQAEQDKRIDYIEFGITDIEKAKKFVNDVVERDFCTLANMKGEELTLRFVENPAKDHTGDVRVSGRATFPLHGPGGQRAGGLVRSMSPGDPPYG